METYIILMGMTEKGLNEIHRIPAFVESLKDKLKKRSVILKGFYKVMGETDYVAIIESPDDKEALGAVMALGKIGYFTTLTLKAYSMLEMKESIDIYSQSYR
ncbi:GYD domain-containing protein [candidate division WOR-3 bacterium]|jgi:uncharacterized protein with GYD domain|nr:GYD domain-containing protein [candidate division WOR-3 bacterium]